MPENFSMVDLVPPYDTFTDTDGKVYNVHTAIHLSTTRLADLRDIQTTIMALQEQLSEPGMAQDADRALKLIPEMERQVSVLMQLIVPDMSMERITEIGMEYKLAFITWWRSLGTPKTPEGEPDEANPDAPRPNRQTRRAHASLQKSRRRASATSIR